MMNPTRKMRLTVVLIICLSPMSLCVPVDFKIYWNVPTDNCHKFGLNFALVHDSFGIIQNTHDTINGDKVVILYRPGLYPYLGYDADGSVTKVNGGVPQNVNLEEHLVVFEQNLEDVVLPTFSGFGIISFEEWRPLFHHSPDSYQKLSIELTPETMSEQEREDLAIKQFEDSAKNFMLETMKRAKKLRPKARWSYHDYHNCFNFVFQEDEASCPPKDEQDNDKLAWLWQAQDFINPLMWVGATWAEPRVMHRIAMTTNEAKRIVNKHHPEAKVIPYLTLSPEGGKYIREDIAVGLFKQMIDHEADGVFIWEIAEDFNSKKQCQNYLDYMKDVFGLAASSALIYVKEQRNKFPNLIGNDTLDDDSDPDVLCSGRHVCKPCRNGSHPTCQPLHIIILFVLVCLLRKF